MSCVLLPDVQHTDWPLFFNRKPCQNAHLYVKIATFQTLQGLAIWPWSKNKWGGKNAEEDKPSWQLEYWRGREIINYRLIFPQRGRGLNIKFLTVVSSRWSSERVERLPSGLILETWLWWPPSWIHLSGLQWCNAFCSAHVGAHPGRALGILRLVSDVWWALRVYRYSCPQRSVKLESGHSSGRLVSVKSCFPVWTAATANLEGNYLIHPIYILMQHK